VVLGAMVGLTSYYQMTYGNQAAVLKEKTQEFTTAINELNLKKVQLNQTSVRLQVESESNDKLGSLYTNIKDEKTILETDLSKTRDTLSSTLVQLEQTKIALIIASQERDDAIDDRNKYKSQMESSKDSYEDCKVDLKACVEA